MQLYHSHTGLPETARGAAIAIGNFDGVHRGHQALIEAARVAAAGGPVGVLSFAPHPRRYFRPDDPPFLLTPGAVKHRRLEACGVAVHYELPFDAALAAQSAESFIREVLVDGLGARHVVVGFNFTFGHNRAGNAALLEEAGARFGFGVTIVPAQQDEHGMVFSSTAIRQLLDTGNPGDAARLMGSAFEIEGVVEHGDKRGRTIGFPTANVALGETQRPRYGVYAVEASLDGTDWWPGVANIGRRPTVDGLRELFEVHLFDRNDDLYGKALRVRLHHFLRPERKFASFDELKAQIGLDAAEARALLGAGGEAGVADW
ncbi:bifunctional riboflavin kinase/FAD synthetase [Radicibacter daui]|uniref:bifunctional riboflavin kinase/FAD synthetase n=1 Tax=Radicibacter daui TaxID=3064829 RepID=UPI004046BA83